MILVLPPLVVLAPWAAPAPALPATLLPEAEAEALVVVEAAAAALGRGGGAGAGAGGGGPPAPAMEAGAAGSLSMVPSALLTFEPRLF